MQEHEFIEFQKRYEKFKKNNLPTPFFDDERQTFEYVYYSNDFFNNDSGKYPEVNCMLTDALADIAFTELYYSFNCKIIAYTKDSVKIIYVIGMPIRLKKLSAIYMIFPNHLVFPKKTKNFIVSKNYII